MTASASTFDVAAHAGVLRLGRRLDHGRIVLHKGDSETHLGKGERPLHVSIHDPRFYGALRHGYDWTR